jgi:hypothetical protein
MDNIIMDVVSCACGGDHLHLVFAPLAKPVEVQGMMVTHFGVCPTTGQWLYMLAEQEGLYYKDGVGKVNAPKPVVSDYGITNKYIVQVDIPFNVRSKDPINTLYVAEVGGLEFTKVIDEAKKFDGVPKAMPIVQLIQKMFPFAKACYRPVKVIVHTKYEYGDAQS